MNKPHIYFTRYSGGQGYWRVSLMPKPFRHTDSPLWQAAYAHVIKLNRGQQ